MTTALDTSAELVVTDVRPCADRDIMYRQFEAEPGDLVAYGAMADLQDEMGYAELAHAFRWMSRRGRWPHKRMNYVDHTGLGCGRKVSKAHRWAWYVETYVEARMHNIYPLVWKKHHALSRLVLRADQKVYPSHQAAVMGLAKLLQALKDVYDVDAPRKGV